MKLYSELAEWFHLLTAPPDYAEAARVYGDLMVERATGPVERVLELGSGGGNTASHLKSRFELTLTDLSPQMLAVNRRLNPECEHHLGDMRTLRLDRRFDAVLLQDAVMYMASERDLQAAIRTAAAHCRPGGVAVFAPDCIAETFNEYQHSGGHDGDDGRALRYHETATDPDPSDETYRVELAMRLREADGTERVETDIYTFGLFGKEQWLRCLTAAGLEPDAMPCDLGGEDVPLAYIFLGVRPPSGAPRSDG